MNATVSGLSFVEKLLTELLHMEQERGKTFSIAQILMLLELKKRAGSKETILLSDIRDRYNMPDFKVSRTARGLTKGGRTIMKKTKDEKQIKGWNLIKMEEYPSNRRWMQVELNDNGARLMKRLSAL